MGQAVRGLSWVVLLFQTAHLESLRCIGWCLVPGLEDPGSFTVCVWLLIASPKPCCTAGFNVVSMAVSGWLDFLPRRQAPRHKCLSSLLLTTSKQCGQAQIQRERAYNRAWIQGDSLVPWWPPLQPFTMSLFCLCPWFSLPLLYMSVNYSHGKL